MEIPINQDIRRYKTKDIGGFSFKEAGFIAIALGAAFATYKLLGSIEAAIIPMAIVLIVGFFKPFGMTFIQFLRTVGKEQLTPRTYIWETDYEYKPDEFDELFGEKIKVSSDWNDIVLSERANNTVNNKNKTEKSLIIR